MKRIKRLMGDKMRFENTKMRVIKWESVWNDDRQEKYGRERERELQMIPITAMNQAIEDSRVATTKKMRRLELLCCFLGKIKFYITFM